MAIEIIQQGEIIKQTYFKINFDYEGHEGWGFGFDCDSEGNIDPNLNPVARANYEACLTGFVDGRKVEKGHFTSFETSVKFPPVGRCHCGEEVELDGFTNTCETCGRDYNWNGSLLAPRECWGEETCESPSDIAMIK